MITTFLLPMLSWLLPTSSPALPGGGGTNGTNSTQLVWSANRPLAWTDFKARPSYPENLAALTSATIDVKVNCVDYQVETVVRAVFVPTESWVRPVSASNASLLNHEQHHFDLTEVHARLLRQKLATAHFNCEKLQPGLNNLTKVAFVAWQREQARYDMETNHGLNLPKQQQWEQTIQQRLEQLSAFAAKE